MSERTIAQLQVGLVQLPNTTDLARNCATMLESIEALASHGAGVIVFPECALTGFSALPRPLAIEELSSSLDALEATARSLGVTAVVPSILERESGAHWNTGWVLGHPRRTAFIKLGLTESERRFFEAPGRGERHFQHDGVRFGVVVCREIDHTPDAYVIPHEIDVLIWPGYWLWGAPLDGEESPLLTRARGWARQCRAPLLQANFCYNGQSLEKPDGPDGQSTVFDGCGELVHCGPKHEPGGVLVTLSRARDRWEVMTSQDVFWSSDWEGPSGSPHT